MVEQPDAVAWRELYQVVDEEGNLENVLRVCTDEHLTKEGFRLLWFHSRSKQTSDAATRATRLQRAIRDLTALRERLARRADTLSFARESCGGGRGASRRTFRA